jgi:hypothetical protein
VHLGLRQWLAEHQGHRRGRKSRESFTDNRDVDHERIDDSHNDHDGSRPAHAAAGAGEHGAAGD